MLLSALVLCTTFAALADITIVPMDEKYRALVSAHISDFESYNLRETQTRPEVYIAVEDGEAVGLISFLPKYLGLDSDYDWQLFMHEVGPHVPEDYRDNMLLQRFLALVRDRYISVIGAFLPEDHFTGRIHQALMAFAVEFYARATPSAPALEAVANAVAQAHAPVVAAAPAPAPQRRGFLSRFRKTDEQKAQERADKERKRLERQRQKEEEAAAKQRIRETEQRERAQELKEQRLEKERLREQRETHRRQLSREEHIPHPTVGRYFPDFDPVRPIHVFAAEPFDAPGTITLPVNPFGRIDTHAPFGNNVMGGGGGGGGFFSGHGGGSSNGLGMF